MCYELDKASLGSWTRNNVIRFKDLMYGQQKFKGLTQGHRVQRLDIGSQKFKDLTQGLEVKKSDTGS